jgi:uncharacterized membrane-anchored protein
MKRLTFSLLAGQLLLALPVLAQDTTAQPAKPEAGDDSGGEEQLTPAQKKRLAEFNAIQWVQSGPGNVGSRSQLELEAGNWLTKSPSEAAKYLRFTGNVPGPKLDAVLRRMEEPYWWATLEFADIGYVKDDEKDDIDADKLLKALKDSQVEDNKHRKSMGLDNLSIDGWAVKPFYNEKVKSVEHGLLVSGEDGGTSVNYTTKILGRHGYTSVTLICDPKALDTSLSQLRQQLTSFKYKSGESYAEYKKGDRIAEIGLTALIAGGGLAVAAKTGLLAKLGKFIVYIFAGIAALVAKFWNGLKNLFGGGRNKGSSAPPPLPPQQ